MACPGGCTNGGGQLRAGEGIDESKELLRRVNEIYATMIPRSAWDNVSAIENYKVWFADDEERVTFLRTNYHAVPKLEVTNPRAIKW